MKNLLREPLLHFALLGALLFAAYRLVNREPKADPQRIVVSAGQIEHMVTTFARTWQRPPTTEEVKGLIDQYVREEMLSREAMKLGLEQNDTVIRRRLQQKMEFIAEDLAAAEPTDADLARYLEKHPDAFRQDQQLTFRHVYLNPEKYGEQLHVVANKLLTDLRSKDAQADISTLGDPTLLDPAFRDEPQRRVEATFGSAFAGKLATLPVGEWSGPVTSEFGTHLVLVEQRTEGRVPTLDEVRPQVRREWENARRIEENRKFLEKLLKQYEIGIDWPKPETKDSSAQR
ncbi:MAG TPA: peptidylprolyl isomerase [Terrimicrobiaceae bacterium]